MIKSAMPYVIYLVLSIVMILFTSIVQQLFHYLLVAYAYLDNAVGIFFTHSRLGLQLQAITTLVLTPLVIVGIPALIYSAVKHQSMPYFIEITWVVWILIALSSVLT